MRKLGCLSVIEEQVFANKKLLSGLNWRKCLQPISFSLNFSHMIHLLKILDNP